MKKAVNFKKMISIVISAIVMASMFVSVPVEAMTYRTLSYIAGDVDNLVGASEVHFNKIINTTFDAAASSRFSRKGYMIKSWYVPSTGETVGTGSQYVMPDHDIDFVANWVPASYTVTFTGKGGKTVENKANINTTATFGTEITLPENEFIYDGYTFNGWKYSGVIYNVGDKFEIPALLSGSKIVFAAVWTKGVQTTTAPVTTTVPETTTIVETTTVPETTTAPETTTIVETTTVPETTTIVETTTVPETTTIVETTTVPETTTIVETTTVPETTTIVETTTVPETTTIVETTTVPETTTVAETTTVPETTTVAETTTVPETTTIVETTTVPETTTIVETTTVPETTTIVETTTVPETTTAPITTTTEPVSENVIGDYNNDGMVDEGDVNALRKYMVGIIVEGFEITEETADVNGDGTINVFDCVSLTRMI